jgi:hypothetical protein
VLFTHIIGPAIAGKSAWEGRHHFRMGSVQPRTCYSLYCSLNDDIPADHVFFQFVVRYTNRSHQWYYLMPSIPTYCVFSWLTGLCHRYSITRVVTQRIATTGSMPNFLESVNSEVVSTLLAKKIVLLSRKLESVDDVLDHLYLLPPRQLCRLFYAFFVRCTTHNTHI